MMSVIGIYRQLRSRVLEVVSHALLLDDNAVHVTPISLPFPTLLGTGSIGFVIRGCHLSGQRVVAMWTAGNRPSFGTVFLASSLPAPEHSHHDSRQHGCAQLLPVGDRHEPGLLLAHFDYANGNGPRSASPTPALSTARFA